MHVDQNQSPAALGSIDTTNRPIRSMNDVLSNWYSRAVLHALQHSDGSVTVTAVARKIVEGHPEALNPPVPLSVERLRPWLREVHIREMDQIGVIGYDPVADVVSSPDDVSLSVASPWRQEGTSPSLRTIDQERGGQRGDGSMEA